MKSSISALMRFKSILICLFTIAGLSSCLELETGIRLKKSGEVETRLTYRLAADTAGFGREFGADEPWPFPLTEKDFRQRSISVPGTEVKRYRTGTESDGSEWIVIDLKSDTMDDFAAYMGLDLSMESEGKDGRMVLTFPETTFWTEFDERFSENLIPLAEKTNFIFTFRPPSKPTDSGIGYLDDRSAVLEITLSELLSSEEITKWTVLW